MTESQFTTEEIKNETWKPVSDYEGLYEISDLGRVKSLNYYGNQGDIGFIRLCRNSSGYVIVSLYRNCKPYAAAVHRLVAMAFLPQKTDAPYVNHKDGNRSNNRITNLEWCTPRENARHRDQNRHAFSIEKRQSESRTRLSHRSPVRKTPAITASSGCAQPMFTENEIQGEEWRIVENLRLYQVSSLGRIRRMQASKGRPQNHILRLAISTTGCWQVSLQCNKKSQRFSVHRLVALAFHGKSPIDKPWVNHKDGDRLNARASNLEWVSPKENAQHAKRELGTYPSGANHPMAKLTKAQVVEIHEMRMNGIAANSIAKVYGVEKISVLRILHRRSWVDATRNLSTNYPPVKRAKRKKER